MSNGKVINRYQSVCKSSYIDNLELKKFITISMFALETSVSSIVQAQSVP